MGRPVVIFDRDSAAAAIRRLNEDDLRFLNRLIIERLKIVHQVKSSMQLSKFAVGERVIFPAPTGGYKTGIIHRLNKKTASIITDDRQQWNVSPGLLKPERDAAASS